MLHIEQSNVQDVSIETSDSQFDEELPSLSEKDSLPEDDEISVLSNEKLQDSEDENNLSGDVTEADLTFSDIQNLIDSAEEGDTIYLNGKNYFGSGDNIIVNKNRLTIIGGSQSDPDSFSTLDAQKLSPTIVVRGGYVVIKGIKFINGYSGYMAGSVYWGGGFGVLDNCYFVNSVAPYGGAVYWDASYGFLNNSHFINCSSSAYGGAVYWKGNFGVLNNSYFENNSAFNGGSIYWISSGRLLNSIFVDNHANNGGGAIFWQKEYATVMGNNFTNNHADNSGGAIFWNGNYGTVSGNQFTKNFADNGGGIFIWGVDKTIFDNEFILNYAENGCAILSEGANINISSNYIDNSNSNKYAIYITNAEGIIIDDNNFTNPEANIGSVTIFDIESNMIGVIGKSLHIPVYIHDILGRPGEGNVTLERQAFGSNIVVDRQTLIDGKASFIVTMPNYSTLLNLSACYYSKDLDMNKDVVIFVNDVLVNAQVSVVEPNRIKDKIVVKCASDATGIVMLDINGNNYFAEIFNGSATIDINGLTNGKYVMKMIYSGDDKYVREENLIIINVENSKPKSPVYKITGNKDIVVNYGAKSVYKVLITKDGKAAGAGEIVTINFNGKKNVVKTDSKGYAVLNIDTHVKIASYMIKTTCNDKTVSNKVIIKQIIKASDKKVKKSSKLTKIKISLIKVDGKYLKGKILKVKFNKKTYKIKTNNKGVAIWKVKKSMVKNLKVGKKLKYSVTYGKDILTKKIIIKK